MNSRTIATCCLAVSVAAGIACGNASTEDTVAPADTAAAPSQAIIDHKVVTLEGEDLDLTSFRGRPMLIVNTASRCGYTPQYKGLQILYEKYSDRGLVVIGFPSNDFGGQEPGSHGEIRSFCKKNYGVSFPMMAKVHTKGPEQAPIYATLTEQTADGIRGEVRWNFTKFLVDADGHVVARFESATDPLDPNLVAAVEGVLSSEPTA